MLENYGNMNVLGQQNMSLLLLLLLLVVRFNPSDGARLFKTFWAGNESLFWVSLRFQGKSLNTQQPPPTPAYLRRS